jgi:ribosome recycling factor
MVSIRNIRHEAMTSLDNLKKSKDIGEDEHKRLVTQIEDQMNKTKSQIEAATKAKEQEILTV